MKGTHKIDPAALDYGASTPALRAMLLEWQAIDWFVPPRDPTGEKALALFHEHNALCHLEKPDVFASDVECQIRHGDWDDFRKLRMAFDEGNKWDWKFAGLKQMAHEHAERLGYALESDARPATADMSGRFFFLIGEGLCWNQIGPTLDLPRAHADVGHWYLGYATFDLTDFIQWQLAERSASVARNPYVPLLRCYAEGFYPFSFGPREVILFGFR